MTSILLTPKCVALRNAATGRQLLKRLPLLFIGAGFWFLIYLGSLKIIGYIRGVEIVGEILSMKLLQMTFFSLTGFIFLSNVITAISSFYLSRDLQFLRTMPIGLTEILKLKAVETFLESSWMVLSFLPPIFVAYGVVYKAPLLFYPIVFGSIALFLIIGSGAGIAVAHLLARIFPARRTRDAFFVLGLVFFVVAYIILRKSTPTDLARPDELIGTLIGFKMNSPFMPNYWVSEIVWSALRSTHELDFVYVASLVSTAFFLPVLALYIGSVLYSGNIESMRPVSDRQRRTTVYPGFGKAVFYKDFKLFIRDTAQWSQVLIIGALLFIYIYNFKSFPIESFKSVTPYVREFLALVNMLMAGMVMSAVSARFIYSSVSLEGQAFWVIQSSPITMQRFLYGKFVYGFLPVFLVTGSIVLLTNLATGIGGWLMAVSLFTVALLCISISGLGTGFGAMHPRFRHENIAQVWMSLPAMVFMLLAFSLVVFTVLVMSVPFYLYYKNGSLHKTGTALAVSSALIVNFAAFYLPMRLGIAKLRRME